MVHKEYFLILVLGILILSTLTVAAKDCHIPAIYNFGDSNSDTGGIAAAFYPMAAPCGERFFHRPAGRGCDGRLIIDFIADKLGLPYLSAYLDSIGTNFQHGANFATGGATIRHINESWFEHGVSPFPLDIQVEHYNQFRARSAYFHSQAKEECDRRKLPRPGDFSKAIYTIDIGQNDIAAGFREQMSHQRLLATIPDTVSQFAAAVRELHKLGARIFWIHNTGPFGCMPVAVIYVKDPRFLDEQGCFKSQNEIAVEFNKQLKNKVIQLRAELPKAKLIYVDIFRAKYELISNAKNQGFEEAFKICCGKHGNGISVWCGNKVTINGTVVYGRSCENPNKVISWDGVHYSEAANFWIANHILNGSFSEPPVPITQACHAQI